MATLVYKNAYVSLGDVDLSAWVQEVSIDDDTDAVDETAMGATTRTNKPGLYAGGWEITFKQDYAAGGPDATYWATLRGATFTALCNPNTSTTGSSNPRFTQTMMVTNYQAVSGAVGDLATATMSLAPSGALARAVE